jgi:CRP-like cAMP-binding protein
LGDQRRTLEGARFRLMDAPKGEEIFHQGDDAEAIYRVERGCVRLQIDGKDGQREVIAFLFSGEVVCVGLETHWASAYAVTDTIVARISMCSLWELISRDASAARDLLVSADKRLRDVADHGLMLSRFTARARLAWFLQWLSGHDGHRLDAFDLPMTRRDIADFLGIAPETVSRLFRQAVDRGDLRRLSGKRYLLRSREAPPEADKPGHACWT